MAHVPVTELTNPVQFFSAPFHGSYGSEMLDIHGYAAAGAFCPAPDVPPCSDFRSDACADCNTCLRAPDLDAGRPSTADTIRLLPGFLQAKPSKQCAKGGLGVYSALFQLNASVTSAFRALSSPLSEQTDFISALIAGRHLVDSVQSALDAAHHSALSPTLQNRNNLQLCEVESWVSS
jgi:hypothetical protein